MIITCKKCSASFNLDESLLKPTGSKVQCAKCNDVFLAYPPTPATEHDELAEIISDLEDEQETKDLEIGEMDESELKELDLPGMEALFAEEEAIEGEDVTDEAVEDFELDLDLEPEADEAQADVEAEAKPDELDELDLSDMDKLLDEDAVVADDALKDFELDLDLEPEAGKVPEDVSSDFEPEEADELDLLEIEKMLDLEEPETEDEAAPEEVELDLDLDLEPELEKALKDVEADVGAEELEGVDLSDIEKMLELEAEEEPEAEEKDEPEDFELAHGIPA